MTQFDDTTEFARNKVACDPYATLLGIELEELRPAYARMRLKVKPEYCNAVAGTLKKEAYSRSRKQST